MIDPDTFEEACAKTVVEGEPTDTFMNAKKFPNGRYLVHDWKDPYSLPARLNGVRENRDDKPVANKSAYRSNPNPNLTLTLTQCETYTHTMRNIHTYTRTHTH